MKQYHFTAYIEKDTSTGLYVGYVPGLQGAHTQAESLDALHANLKEVVALCLEELPIEEKETWHAEFIGTQEVSINI